VKQSEVQEVIERLEAAFPDPPIPDKTKQLYARMLIDLDYAEVDPAVDELIATTMRLPTVSRVRRAVIEPKLDIPTSEEAWVAVQSHGELHDLAKRVAHLLGGTFNIRTSEDPELTRVRFAKVYDELRRKEVDRALAAGIRAQRMKLSKVS
jgi:hypothetical protein